MAQKRPPDLFDDDIENGMPPEVLDDEQPEEVSDSPTGRTAWEHLTQAPDVVRNFARSVSDRITTPTLATSPTGQGGIGDTLKTGLAMLQGFRGGAAEGAAEMLNPLDIASTLTGTKAMSATARGLSTANKWRRAAQALSAPNVVHGGINLLHPDSTLGERALGVAETAGGLAGMHYPSYFQGGRTARPGNYLPDIDVTDMGNVPQGALQGALPPMRRSREVPYSGNGPQGPIQPIRPQDTPEMASRPSDSGDALSKYLNLSDTQVSRTTTPKKVGASSTRLARDLQGARPRFNFGKEIYEPEFEDDLDKSLFILAQTNPSKRNADYLNFAMEQTGLDEAGVIRLAYDTKKRLKAMLQGQPSGPVKIPSSGVIESLRQPKTLDVNEPVEGTTAEDLMALNNEQTIKKLAEQRGTPEDIPNNDIARNLETERKGLEQEAKDAITLLKPDVQPAVQQPFQNPFAKPNEVLTPELAGPDIASKPELKFASDALARMRENEPGSPGYQQAIQDLTSLAPKNVTPGQDLALPESPSAKFAHWFQGMPEAGIDAFPQFHVKGGDYDGSHVGIERMKELGIDPGDYPSNLATAGTPEGPAAPEGLSVRQPQQALSPTTNISDPVQIVKERGTLSLDDLNNDPVKIEAYAKHLIDEASGLPTDNVPVSLDLRLRGAENNIRNTPDSAEADKILQEIEAASDRNPPIKNVTPIRQKKKALAPETQPTPEVSLTTPIKKKASVKSPLADKWQAIVKELDKEKAPDSSYRDILSTGSKNKLKKGETWRGKVLEYIKLKREMDTEQANKAVDPEDKFASENPTFSRVKPPRKYEDLTPDRYKRYKVFDGNDKLIHETTDYDEAHRMADNEDGFVKDGGDTPRSDDEPSFAKSGKGGIKIGVNVKRAADELTTGYSGPLEGVMAREGLQNAIDAIRALGNNGKITIKVESKAIVITDNGKGMSRNELETVYSDLHSSGKTGEEGTTGGKGVGKAPGMLGGTNFLIETVVFKNGKKIKSSMGGTPEELMTHVEVDEVEVPLSTPTGTMIRTDLKEDQNAYSVDSMIRKITEYSRNLPGKLTVEGRYGDPEPDMPFKTDADDKIIATETFDGNKISVRIPNDAERKPRRYTEVHYLNNGMYQYSDNYHAFGEDVPNMPDAVVVDIQPSAKEGSPDYPFPVQRESIKETLAKSIKDLINLRLAKPEAGKRKNTLVDLYTSMSSVEVEGTTRKAMFYDPGNRLTPEERTKIDNSPAMKKLTVAFDQAIDDVLYIMGNDKWRDKLEGVGIVMDPGLHGVHIPNPDGSKKSTILINPFIFMGMGNPADAALNSTFTILHEVGHIGDEAPTFAKPLSLDEINDPRVGKFLQSYMEQVMSHGDVAKDTGHGVPFLKRLGGIYGEFGPTATFREADAIQAIYTGNGEGESGGYSSEIQELLSIYQESRGRDAVTEDFLSGTGIKSKTPRGGKKDLSGSNKANGKRVASGAVNKLLLALEESIPLRAEQEAILRKERGRKFAAFDKVKADGEEGARKSLAKLRGEHTKVEGVNLNINQEERDSLFTAIKEANITTTEKARAYVAIFKILNGEGVPQRNELSLLDSAFGGGFGNKIVEMHGGLGMVKLNLAKSANTMKALMSSMDVSGPLRQGIGLIHKKEWRSAFVEMFKYLGDKEYYDAAMEQIEERPTYVLGREAGLFIAGRGNLVNTEEAFMDNFIPNLPGISHSERAYTGFLNKLRADVWDTLIQNAQRTGAEVFTIVDGKPVPSPLAFQIADFINNKTGRGHLGRFEKIAPELNTILWSPRLLASRLNTLNPMTYIDPKIDPFVRKESIKSLLAVASSGLTLLGLAAAYGEASGEDYKINMDPTNSDFGKIRFGNKIHDPWAGHQQIVVAAARFLNGFRKGKPVEGASAIGRFGVNKLSPMASLAYEVGTAKSLDKSGNLVDQYNNKSTVPKEVLERFAPMFIQGLTEVLTENPDFADGIKDIAAGEANASSLPHAIPSIFGAGVQTYPEPSNGPKLRKPGLARLSP